jgi:hypothetical protein
MTMPSTTEIRIPATGVRSLVRDGPSLVDWADGGQRYFLDGETVPRSVRYAYPFDAAVSLPGSAFAVIYTKGGTKGLILRDGEIQREINRSYYFADRYEYPIALFRLRSGREVLAHCPDEYCRLEIEDLATGEVLTRSTARKPSDFFHSRLAASADGLHLVSAGWLWHPVDEVRVFSVETSLEDPKHLDGKGIGIDAWAEESSATFSLDGRLTVALRIERDEDGNDKPLATNELRSFDLSRPAQPVVARAPEKLGTVMAVGTSHLLALYKHPRLIDARSGSVVKSWPHIFSGTQTTSIFGQAADVPATALDGPGLRCAFADDTGITVLQFGAA